MKEIIALAVAGFVFITTFLLYIKKHIVMKAFIILLIFSIIAGLAVANYDAVKLRWKGVELETMQKEIAELKVQLKQTLNLKQNITTIVNNITKVEREIADIKEVMHKLYSSFKTEVFQKGDLNKKMKVFENFLYPDGKWVVIFFELENIAEKNSVIVSSGKGIAPTVAYGVDQNIISLRQEIRKGDVLKEETDFYAIKYIPSLEVGVLGTVEDMEFEELEDGNYTAKFRKK